MELGGEVRKRGSTQAKSVRGEANVSRGWRWKCGQTERQSFTPREMMDHGVRLSGANLGGIDPRHWLYTGV